LGYEWIGATAIGIAGIWGTIWSGSQQRKSQHKIAREQDWGKSNLELEKEKRLAYSRLLGKLNRAITFATADKTVRQSILELLERKSSRIEEAFSRALSTKIPSETPDHLTEMAVAKMREEQDREIQKITKEVTEEQRIRLLKSIGYGNADMSAHIAVEDLYAGAAEASFLSEGALTEPATNAILALMQYLVSQPSDSKGSDIRLKKVQECVENLRMRMQVDLNSVPHSQLP